MFGLLFVFAYKRILITVKEMDAGAMVGQGGRRGTQGHSRPMTREANRKLGGSGVATSAEKFCDHTLDLLKMLNDVLFCIFEYDQCKLR